MKVKVINRYVDKHTKELMEVDTITEYPKERASELMKYGYVKAVREPKKTEE